MLNKAGSFYLPTPRNIVGILDFYHQRCESLKSFKVNSLRRFGAALYLHLHEQFVDTT